MNVKLLMGRVGDRFAQSPGQVIDVPEDEARRLIERGIAEPLDAETATAKPAKENRGAK